MTLNADDTRATRAAASLPFLLHGTFVSPDSFFHAGPNKVFLVDLFVAYQDVVFRHFD